ncbi:hypothetical protein D9M72_358430 [compost metagenome]
MHVRRVRGQVDRCLPRRIAAAHQHRRLVLAQLGLHRRGPVVHAAPFKMLQRGDVRAPVLRTGGDHHGMGRDHAAIGQLQPDRVRATMQCLDLQRDGDMRAELQRLHERAPGQRLPGDAGGKAKIVLDPGTRARLPARRAAIDHRHRQAFGRGIHGRGQPGRPGADHHHVIDVGRIELRQQPQARSQLPFVRRAQHAAVGADHQREVAGGRAGVVEQQ